MMYPSNSALITQALVSFKKYMPPPLPYFKVNICPFSPSALRIIKICSTPNY
jgi:hypothetical protein